jgi:hypothetical protein
MPLAEDMSETHEVKEVHSDWHTPFMIYLRMGALPDVKDECE